MPSQDLSRPGMPPTRPVLPLHGVMVLVVEDSRFACEALRLMCQHSGARMRRADSLAQARRHLAVWRPDVAIVDLGLPDGEGTDLIRDLAAPPGFGPALLAISGDPDLRGAALAAGAAGFLEKPVHSLLGFQTTILRLFPGAPLPDAEVPGADLSFAGLPFLGRGVPAGPDRLALTDDLMHAADLLAQPCGPVQRGYLARFVAGLARSAGDRVLAQAALQAAARDDALAALSDLVQARLAAAPAPFGPAPFGPAPFGPDVIGPDVIAPGPAGSAPVGLVTVGLAPIGLCPSD